jgi:excisionase family DNA binding protein
MKTTDSSQLELDGVAGKIILCPSAAKTTERGDESSSPSANPHTGNRGRTIVRPLAREKPSGEQGRAEASGLETLLNFAESARVLGVSLRQFRRLVDGGKIAFVKISERSPRVRPSELQRFLAASVVKYSEVQS